MSAGAAWFRPSAGQLEHGRAAGFAAESERVREALTHNLVASALDGTRGQQQVLGLTNDGWPHPTELVGSVAQVKQNGQRFVGIEVRHDKLARPTFVPVSDLVRHTMSVSMAGELPASAGAAFRAAARAALPGFVCISGQGGAMANIRQPLRASQPASAAAASIAKAAAA